MDSQDDNEAGNNDSDRNEEDNTQELPLSEESGANSYHISEEPTPVGERNNHSTAQSDDVLDSAEHFESSPTSSSQSEGEGLYVDSTSGLENTNDVEMATGSSTSEPNHIRRVEVIGRGSVRDDGAAFSVKLPFLMGVEPGAYSREQVMEEQLNLQENETSQNLKIRYRKVGHAIESNSRLVRWEDGSASLFIGRECFDITEQDISTENQLYLFRRQPTAQVAECRIFKKLKIQPATISKGVQRKLSTSERFAKERRVKMAEMDRAPELEEQKLAQLEHERARAQARLEAKRRRKEQAMMENLKSSGISSEFLENDRTSESDEDPTFSIENIKSQIMGKKKLRGSSSDTELQGRATWDDRELSSELQMERENPSRLDALRSSDKPPDVVREPTRISDNNSNHVEEPSTLLEMEHRHHKIFLLTDEDDDEESEWAANNEEKTVKKEDTSSAMGEQTSPQQE
eukprot:jgi/Galph1/5641/GphlegSOOS_G4200.1